MHKIFWLLFLCFFSMASNALTCKESCINQGDTCYVGCKEFDNDQQKHSCENRCALGRSACIRRCGVPE